MPRFGNLSDENPPADYTISRDASTFQPPSSEADRDTAGLQAIQAEDKNDATFAQIAFATGSNRVDGDESATPSQAFSIAVERRRAVSKRHVPDQMTRFSSAAAATWARKLEDLYPLAAERHLEVLHHRSRVIELDRSARYTGDDVNDLANAVITELQSLTTSSKSFKAALPFQNKTSKFLKALNRFRKDIKKAERAHERLLDVEQDLQELDDDIYNDIVMQISGAAGHSDRSASTPSESRSPMVDEENSARNDLGLSANLMDSPVFAASNILPDAREFLDPLRSKDRAAGVIQEFTEYTATSDIAIEMSSLDAVLLVDSPYGPGDDIVALGAQFDTGTITIPHDVETKVMSNSTSAVSHKPLLQAHFGFVKLLYIGRSAQRRLLDLTRMLDRTSATTPYDSQHFSQQIKDIQYQPLDTMFPRATIDILTSKRRKEPRGDGGNLHVQNWLDDPNWKTSCRDDIRDSANVVNEDAALNCSLNLNVYHEPDTDIGLNGMTASTQYAGVPAQLNQTPSDLSISISPASLHGPHTVDQMEQRPRHGDITTNDREVPVRLQRRYSWPNM